MRKTATPASTTRISAPDPVEMPEQVRSPGRCGTLCCFRGGASVVEATFYPFNPRVRPPLCLTKSLLDMRVSGWLSLRRNSHPDSGAHGMVAASIVTATNRSAFVAAVAATDGVDRGLDLRAELVRRSEEHTSELQSRENLGCRL